jgi:hypothetical protein
VALWKISLLTNIFVILLNQTHVLCNIHTRDAQSLLLHVPVLRVCHSHRWLILVILQAEYEAGNVIEEKCSWSLFAIYKFGVGLIIWLTPIRF